MNQPLFKRPKDPADAEIERLEKRITQLESALQRIADGYGDCGCEHDSDYVLCQCKRRDLCSLYR